MYSVSAHYGVYNVGEILPVVIFMNEDKEVERLIGEKTREEIYDFVERNR